MIVCKFYTNIYYMHKAYKYKLSPSKEQINTLINFMGASRFVYNYALSKRKEDYE